MRDQHGPEHRPFRLQIARQRPLGEGGHGPGLAYFAVFRRCSRSAALGAGGAVGVAGHCSAYRAFQNANMSAPGSSDLRTPSVHSFEVFSYHANSAGSESGPRSPTKSECRR